MEKLNEKKILIIGAGPVGLAAALFISHKGARPFIVEKLTDINKHSKALGINPRTFELMGQIGAFRDFIKNSYQAEHGNFYYNSSLLFSNNFQGVEHENPFMAVQPQHVSEMVLTDILSQRDINVVRGTEAKIISLRNDQVECELKYSDGKEQVLTFDYVFCADGAHSSARKYFGLKFEGSSFEEPWFLYDAKLRTELKPNDLNVFIKKNSFIFLIRVEADIWRIISNDLYVLHRLPNGNEVENIVWKSDFIVNHRMIERFSCGNVFFGGDAAHVHSPLGGRGMNLGIEDAYVFAELLASNKLDKYDGLRKKAVKNLISKVEFFTNVLRGKTFFYRLIRSLTILIMPYVFPFMQKKNQYLFFWLRP